MWLALNLIMNRSNRAAKGSVHCHCKSVRACTSNWALSSEHLERLRVSQCCYCCAKTFLKLRISFEFRLWATQRESVINGFQKSVCLVTCPIHIGQNRCSSSKGILESSVRNILVKNWLSRCVSRICPVPLHCPVTLTATLGNPVIHGETALRQEAPAAALVCCSLQLCWERYMNTLSRSTFTLMHRIDLPGFWLHLLGFAW